MILYEPPSMDMLHYFGLAKVTILPPCCLFHPVLPFTQEGKLTFPLCWTYAQENVGFPLHDMTYQCSHTDK